LFGDSNCLRQGQPIYTYGNAKWLPDTVGYGIVSNASRRHFGYGCAQGDIIQIDATTNQGNSGGAIFTEDGHIMGMPAYIMERSTGLGFAIPSNVIRDLVPELRDGNIYRAYLGIYIYIYKLLFFILFFILFFYIVFILFFLLFFYYFLLFFILFFYYFLY
jgi:serine protease Do